MVRGEKGGRGEGWVEAKNRVFSMKAMYKTLEPRSSFFFPLKSIWKNCVQPKLCLFAWEATWGRILTLGQKRLYLG